MPLPEGILPVLLADSSISAAVGARIQPVPAPDTVDVDHYPCITFQIVSDFGDNANDGPVGVNSVRVVFDCHALRYLDARNIARAVGVVLDGFSGDLPDGTHIEETDQVNLVDGFEDGSRIYKTTVHWLAKYRS